MNISYLNTDNIQPLSVGDNINLFTRSTGNIIAGAATTTTLFNINAKNIQLTGATSLIGTTSLTGNTTVSGNVVVSGNLSVGSINCNYNILPNLTTTNIGYTYTSTQITSTLIGSNWTTIRSISGVSSGVYIAEGWIGIMENGYVFYPAITATDISGNQYITKQFNYFNTGTNIANSGFYGIMSGSILTITSNNSTVNIIAYQNGSNLACTSYLTITRIA